jgi:plastocyanin
MLGAMDLDTSAETAGGQGLVVFVEGVLRAAGAPDGEWTLAQRGQRFEPAVLGVPVGASVAFPNFDPVFHNVFSYSKTKRFDLGRYGRGKSRSVTFEDPGVVRIFCDIHSNMAATIVVANSHYVTTTNARGEFELKSLPNGEHVLVAVDAEANRREWKVRVGDEPTRVDFDF